MKESVRWRTALDPAQLHNESFAFGLDSSRRPRGTPRYLISPTRRAAALRTASIDTEPSGVAL